MYTWQTINVPERSWRWLSLSKKKKTYFYKTYQSVHYSMIQNACNFNDHLNYIYSIIIYKHAQNHWLFMILYLSASNTCPVGWFRCNDGQCISLNDRCDGRRHCSNGEDEQKCCEFNRICLISIMFVSHLCKRSVSHDHRVYYTYRFGECFILNLNLLYIEYVVKSLLHK